MNTPRGYWIYAYNARDGFTKWWFSNLRFCREGGDALVSAYPEAGYKIVSHTGHVIRRVNYTD